MENLLVVIDMVNGFVNFGNLADKKINRIVPSIKSLIENSLKNGDKIVAFKDTHSEDDIEFQTYPVHCVRGSEECTLIPELAIFETRMQIIEKPTTNGFITQEFQKLISENNFDKISVCGCCTDICVSNFLESLNGYLKMANKKTEVIVFEDAVDTFNSEGHNADEINKKYIEIFKNKYNAKIKKVNA